LEAWFATRKVTGMVLGGMLGIVLSCEDGLREKR
jgi:hypothetical protein